MSLLYSMYTIVLALRVIHHIQQFREENPPRKTAGHKKKKKKKKRRSNSYNDQISYQSKPKETPTTLPDNENENLKSEVKRLRQSGALEVPD